MIAQLLTGTRLLLVVPFFLWMLREQAALAAIAIVVAIVTDLLDGVAARRAGTASAAGRLFDHATDFAFVSAGLIALVLRGLAPWLLPLLVAVAFSQYLIDSYWLHRQRELRMSWLGRWNGVLYFVPACVDVGGRLLGVSLAAPLGWICWGLAVSTVLSIVDRLTALRSTSRTVPDSRA